MLIENSDALKAWLSTCLGRLCDADPAALAKYIIALVKKDKAENELKEFCADQLDVFLLGKTKPFVDLLFETLRTRSYLQTQISSPTATHNIVLMPVYTAEKNTSSNPAFNGTIVASKTSPSCPINVDISSTNFTSPVKNDATERKVRDAGLNVESKRFSHRSRSSSKSRSRSPFGKGGVCRTRENCDRSRRRFSLSDEERRRSKFPHRRFENRHGDRRQMRAHASDRERARERDRENRLSRVCERSNNSTTAGRERSRSPTRSRTRSRSCSFSSRSRSRSSSWGSRSRDRSKERGNRPDSRNSRHKADTDTPQQQQPDHGDTDYRVGAAHTQKSSAPRTIDNESSQFGSKETTRCQDYDEKGYCMRGDLCLFDHGADPLVVEDVSVLNTFNVPERSSQQVPPDPNSPLPPPPPSTPPLPPLPPPLPPPTNSYAPEPYNPEAPGMNRPFWPPPPGPPPHLPPGPPPPPPPGLTGVPPFNPCEPPPPFGPKLQRTRELIGVPTLGEPVSFNVDPLKENMQAEQLTVFSSHQMTSMQKCQTSTINVTNTMPSIGPVPSEMFPKRKPFDYNRLGPRKPVKRNKSDRCTLELRKIPRHLNTITLLNNHFCKFGGTIVNLQVCYDGDPEAALVQFLNHAEATAAYRSTEAVLNNRFIKVFWHNCESTVLQPFDGKERDTCSMSNASKRESGKQDLGNPTTDSPPELNSSFPNNFCPTNKSEKTPERSVVFSPKKKGTLSRTVFNPAALKKSNMFEIDRKYKEQRKDAFKKRFDLHRKKQLFLQSHIENQKMLVDKLSKSKNEKEREFLKQTIEDIGLKIVNLQTDIKKESEEILLTKQTELKSQQKIGNKIEIEKQLLDAEMDLYKNQRKGEHAHTGEKDDTTELLYKVNDLRQQAKALGLLDCGTIRGRAVHVKTRRPSLRFRGRGRGLANFSTSLDHRTRKIKITKTADIDLDVLKKHFLQFGVENIELTDMGTIATFKTRKDAEGALSVGTKCGEHSLSLSFYQDRVVNHNEQLIKIKQDQFDSILGLDKEQQDQLLEEEEEEEEEDSEARSWRR